MQNVQNLSKKDVGLLEVAQKHAKKSYKSGQTTIAAALRTKNGNVYTGINIKYRVRNTSMCAERLAIFKAIEAGERNLDTIVGVKYFPKRDTYKIVVACGECRQVAAHHAPIKTIINNKGVTKIVSIEALLPHAYK
ncbi:reverse transcriptase-like protein [Candidatus Roizmanbacteria bacterium]|nr:reverse transcriptase-like protein [Candidatus Roizmanbacteria bacterium]